MTARLFALLALLLAAAGCRKEELVCHGDRCAPCGPEGCSASQVDVIHRSVGYGSTTPLAAGDSNPLRIEGSVAVFDAPLPDRVGVGDALVTIFGETSSIAFVTRRRSATAYELQTAEGGPVPDAPTATASWWLYRAYASLLDAADRTPNPGIPAALGDFDGGDDRKDLVATAKTWSIACYADAVDQSPDVTGRVTFQYWKTDRDHYLRIYAPASPSEVGASQRHQGVPDPSRYELRSTVGGDRIWTVLILVGNARVEGLQLVSTSSDVGSSLLFVGGGEDGEVQVGGNLFLGNPDNAGSLDGAVFGPQHTTAASTLVLYDNVFHGLSGDGMVMNTADSPNAVARLYSNTFHAVRDGIYTGPGRLVAVNNRLGGLTGECVTVPELVDPASDYNLCSTSQPMTGAHSASGVSPRWVDPDAGDLHLAADDTAATGRGADLSADPFFPFDVDFEGDVRTGRWDVGADQR